MTRFMIILVAALIVMPLQALAKPTPRDVVTTWYEAMLQLVRHTPTYSPPVASRAMAYFGVVAYEATASGDENLQTLAGQLRELGPLPTRETGAYDEAFVLHAALSSATAEFFSNTGPIGQRVIQKLTEKFDAELSEGLDKATITRSRTHGAAITAHVLQWSQNDGGAKIENMGFPLAYDLKKGGGNWVPTSTIAQQQAPLLPDWGKNRTFAMPKPDACALPPPPIYSEDKGSDFFKEAQEVYDITRALTKEQKAIARFWSDDPMMSPTPPGHWTYIALNLIKRDKLSLRDSVDVLSRVGVSQADAFIGNWQTKYQYDLLRPVTYIKRVIDKAWTPMLITPPFPEYPSGHSTQSSAIAEVLTAFFGENFAFSDETHVRDGLAARDYKSFRDAANEAGISRLYGGIHFRSAIERGLEQGACIGAFAVRLKTRK